MKSGENDRKKGGHVGSIILHTVTGYGFLSAGILIAVVGAVVLALIPPLVLGDIVDTLTTGSTLPLKRGEIRKQAKSLKSSRLWTAGKQVTTE